MQVLNSKSSKCIYASPLITSGLCLRGSDWSHHHHLCLEFGSVRTAAVDTDVETWKKGETYSCKETLLKFRIVVICESGEMHLPQFYLITVQSFSLNIINTIKYIIVFISFYRSVKSFYCLVSWRFIKQKWFYCFSSDCVWDHVFLLVLQKMNY